MMSPEHVAMAAFRESIDWPSVAVITAALLGLVWVIRAGLARAKTRRVVARENARCEYEATTPRWDYEVDDSGWGEPGYWPEHVTPLDPADLPTVTTDDEALEAMMRLALAEDLPPAETEQRVKDAIKKKEKGQ